MHPLAQDLSKLTDVELQEKHNDLTKKMSWAYRTGSTGLIGQMQMILEDFNFEIQARQRKMLDDLAKNNPKFNGTINIS
jgi:hypothetical protein